MKDCYKPLYANKMDNPEEAGKFLERYNLYRLNQEEVEDTTSSVTSTKTETMILNLPIIIIKQLHNWMASQANSIKHLEKSYHSSFLKSSKKSQGKEHSGMFCEATITLIPKPDKNITYKKENYKAILMMNIDAKNLNKILAN